MKSLVKLISLVKGLYDSVTCRVLHDNRLSSRIPVTTGIGQGCVLSPLLFNIVLDLVMRRSSMNECVIRWGMYGLLEDLDYADDICLL